MELWQIGLYSVASLLSLKSLTTLMADHRNRIRRDAAIRVRLREINREAEEKAAAEEAQKLAEEEALAEKRKRLAAEAAENQEQLVAEAASLME